MKLKPNDKFLLSEEAIKNYGEQYRDKIFTVTHAANQYMPAKEFYHRNQPQGYHPGYDEGLIEGLIVAGHPRPGLYDADELTFSLYDWEVIKV